LEKSDDFLVRKIQKGDRKSFEILIIRYEKQIFNLIYRMIGNQDAVTDIAQETFLKAFQSIKNFRRETTFYNWIKRIAINNSINYINYKARYSYNSEYLETKEISQKPNVFIHPEDKLLSSELKLKIKEAIEEIPPQLKLVIIMREFEDLSYQEIADILKCPIGTVRSRLFHARQKLKEKLDSYM